MAERATLRNGKGSADHNDRTKSSSKENISHPEMTKHNKILFFNYSTEHVERVPQGKGLLRQKEIETYGLRYGKSLERKNKHYRDKGNKKQIKSVEEAYSTAPIKETILQIGKGRAHSPEELQDAVLEFAQAFDKKFSNVALMSISMHFDEDAVHAHMRWTLEHTTDKGDIEINQNAALREMGFEAKEPFDEIVWRANNPDVDIKTKPGKKKMNEARAFHERYDNPMIAFTDEMRTLWYDTLERQGYDIIRETAPENVSRRNKTTQRYKQEKLADEVKKRRNELRQLDNTFERTHALIGLTMEQRARYNAMEQIISENGLEDVLDAMLGVEKDDEQEYDI